MAATTATAGIIVGVVTLTGLGLKIAGLIVALAGGTLVLTVIYSAIAVWLLGLAVPVTASYIIAAVMVAPALMQSGVPDFAAHMFIFYYAVLSEVSPPTALSPFAAAALTGGNPFRTMMLTWKYTLPAFLVPFVFTLRPEGSGHPAARPPVGTSCCRPPPPPPGLPRSPRPLADGFVAAGEPARTRLLLVAAGASFSMAGSSATSQEALLLSAGAHLAISSGGTRKTVTVGRVR